MQRYKVLEFVIKEIYLTDFEKKSLFFSFIKHSETTTLAIICHR